MKIKALLVGGVILGSSLSYVKAQDESKSFLNTLSVGAKAGPMFFHGDIRQYDYYPVTSYHNEWGFGGGISAAKALGPVLSIEGDLLFGKLSGTRREAGMYFNANVTEMSLNGVVNISNLVFSGKGGDRKLALFGYAGFGLASFRSAKYTLKYDDVDRDQVVGAYGYTVNGDELEKSDRTTEAVIPLGIGVKYRLTPNINLGFDIGLRGLNSDRLDVTESGTAKDKYSGGMASITYKFGDRSDDQEWVDPLETAVADVKEIKDKIEGLTSDKDKDGVPDMYDVDNNTAPGVATAANGKAIDTDRDGVPDDLDQDPFSNIGAKVDENGVELDSDGDGIADSKDREPNTKPGAVVNIHGVAIANVVKKVIREEGIAVTGSSAGFPSVYFDLNSAKIDHKSYQALAKVAQMLKKDKTLKVKVVGHTDSHGSPAYNKQLGVRRSNAAIAHLVNIYGIERSRLIADSKGKTDPLAKGNYDNMNRRVDFIIVN